MNGIETSASPSVSLDSCWTIADGATGHQTQVRGLAEAIGLHPQHRDCRLRFPWSFVPSPLVPHRETSFRWSATIKELAPPQLIISCGRQAAIAALSLKNACSTDVVLIHLQDPQVGRKFFDFIVVPEHDQLQGSNVLSTLGALHHLSLQKLQESAQRGPVTGLDKLTSRFVAVLLGGPNKYYAFDQTDVKQLIANLQHISHNGLQLAIIPSRRTPKPALATLHKVFANDHFVWNGAGENPYLPALALCSCCVVTGDSISMISEATATGQPVYIHELNEKRPARKFRKFHQSMIDRGYTRRLDGTDLEEWVYEPPNEAARIAAIIQKHLNSRFQSCVTA